MAFDQHMDSPEMTLSSHRRRVVLSMLCIGLSFAAPAGAADTDPAIARIRSFYDALLDTMKQASRTSVRTRYDRLAPAVRATFDLPAMTRIAVGPAWTTIPAPEQQALIEQFGRLTIATYANRFDGYSGERFEVDSAVETRGANRIVHSQIIRTKGDPVVLNYLVHPVDDGWKAIDVYLTGTISELATRRSEFGTLLRDGGPASLIESLRQRADRMLQPT
ncbi:MAG: ABC transporter substrate-binding protein [Burkholderiaceae bacterium]